MQGLRAASRCAFEAVRTVSPMGKQALQSKTCMGCRVSAEHHIHHLKSSKVMSSAAGCSLTTTTALLQEKPTEAQRAVWHTLSLSQKKAILRPNKGRKHFDRMWEKDAQIKVRAFMPQIFFLHTFAALPVSAGSPSNTATPHKNGQHVSKCKKTADLGSDGTFVATKTTSGSRSRSSMTGLFTVPHSFHVMNACYFGAGLLHRMKHATKNPSVPSRSASADAEQQLN